MEEVSFCPRPFLKKDSRQPNSPSIFTNNKFCFFAILFSRELVLEASFSPLTTR